MAEGASIQEGKANLQANTRVTGVSMKSKGRARSEIGPAGAPIRTTLLGSDEMGKRPKNRWIMAILLAILFPAAAFHFSCVAVMGPGTWGSGIEEKLPEFLAEDSNPAIGRYAAEFAAQPMAESDRPELPDDLEGVPGQPFFIDRDEASGTWVAATHGGKNWIGNQRLFVAQGEPPSVSNEIEIPPGWTIERPSILRKSGKPLLAIGRWNAWSIPALAKLGRYFRSYRNPELRAEHTIYLYGPESREWSYFGPGHSLTVAPDRGKAALLRSGALGAGYYSLHVWDVDSGEITTVLSLRDVDEGSGRSFEFRWSADSRALQIAGATGGFERRKLQALNINLIYLPGDGTVYQVSSEPTDR